MRLAAILLTLLAVSGCKHGPDAGGARQAVVDRLTQMGMPVDKMDISITNFEPKGDEADATVSLTLKDSPGSPPMVLPYHFERQGGKWVATLKESGGGHGGATPPASAPSPHSGGGAMPSPEDLPPAGKKK